MFPVVVAAMHLPMRYVLRQIPGDKPATKASTFETIDALIVTASPTDNDMRYGSGAEARL